ncbi:hypothetical protein M3223_13345 [Paenibacillus pasadenensis]|uniref:hypothetical protein n=1 Tax=Paenibacillus pasadenensis TaxID=217090 RepID=UPI00203F6A78|nr:hypothetical protein [Paenibacillus pasadenensis]MCM3748336.1 hypothetical protein [Paenibacillus pasadenensis]
MNKRAEQLFQELEGDDKSLQMEAFSSLVQEMENPVDWAYEVWDKLESWLTDKDNHKRSRGAQFLAALAKSDPEKRLLSAFPALWKVTFDDKTVTARHALQNIWKAALSGPEQNELVVNHLEQRFRKAAEDKHPTLVRFDITESLRKLYDKQPDERLRVLALELIEREQDAKYKKKYAALWK